MRLKKFKELNEEQSMKDSLDSMLNGLVGEEDTKNILDNMFSDPIEDYRIGNLISVKELKELPENAVIHLHYLDLDGQLRCNEFVKLFKNDDDGYRFTTDGYTLPLKGHSDDELIKDFDNSDWTFTIRKAIKR